MTDEFEEETTKVKILQDRPFSKTYYELSITVPIVDQADSNNKLHTKTGN